MSAALERQPRPWLLTDESEFSFRMRLARQAQGQWEGTPAAKRAQILASVADKILDRLDELADLVHEEQGKQRVEAIGMDLGTSLASIRWITDNGPRLLADKRLNIPWLPHRRARTRHRPFGVMLVIAPWNFPIAIPLTQVISALMAGNAVILKPSELTPRCGDAIADLLEHLPPGLLQVVHGDGRVGAALIQAGPDKVVFTGSTATGRKVMAAAAKHPIPVSLELGGIDAMVVFEDADLELASSAIAWGATFNGGQACASVERVIVHEHVSNVLIGKVKDKMAQIRPDEDLGRTTAEMQRKVYRSHMADARERSLDIACGGEELPDGRWAPTAISGDAITASKVWCEETFGPIVAFASFRTEAEAKQLHDSVPTGLTASVYSGDIARGERFAERLRVGCVSINEIGGGLYVFGEVPWGGVGPSGFGRSHGADGLLDNTWTQVVDSSRGVSFKAPWMLPYDVDQAEVIRNFVEVIGRRGTARVGAAGRLVRAFGRMLVHQPRF